MLAPASAVSGDCVRNRTDLPDQTFSRAAGEGATAGRGRPGSRVVRMACILPRTVIQTSPTHRAEWENPRTRDSH